MASTAASPLATHLVVPAELEITAGSTRKRRWIALITLSAAVVTAVVITAFSAWRSQDDRAFKEFWRPMLSSGGPILFCVADQSQYSTMTLRDAADPSRQHTITDTITAVVIDDVTPLVNIADLLHSNQRSYRVKNEASTTLTDLRQNPTVLVGAFDNAWTLRETADLRFHFANREDMSRLWIEDRANPGKLDWLLDRSEQQKGVYKDFAIVARFIDPNTDQLVIVVAGIARGGTVAAGEFLIDQHQINDLAMHAPYDWAKKNMELVLETQVIDGRSGPPRLVASYFW